MSPRETVVILNLTRKTIHSVHAENANALTERTRVAGIYPNVSYAVMSLEEAETNIKNSIRQEFVMENERWSC